MAETINFRQHHDVTVVKNGNRNMQIRLLIALAIWCGSSGGGALAQQPAQSPAAQAATEYGLPITIEQAKAVAVAAVAEAKRNNWHMAIAIVGPAGELIYFERMDGTQLASAEISHGKARTAVMFRRPSKAFADQYAAGNTAFLTFPERPVASEGGVPIVVGGKIIGAIGASGGTGQQDGMTANAGANAAK
jgi:glc operon protein GlcG